jgi:hypothetical protein
MAEEPRGIFRMSAQETHGLLSQHPERHHIEEDQDILGSGTAVTSTEFLT